MKRMIPLILVSVFCLWTSLEAGQIYEWIDKNGVKHFTNEPPPPGAKVVNEQTAIQYNEEADQKRTQEDQEALEQDLNQQESQAAQQTVQQAENQPQTPTVQSNDSGSDDAAEGVVEEPYVREREQLRRYGRHKKEREEIVTPLPGRNRMDERIR